MASIIEKRRSLHKNLQEHKLQNDLLKSQLAQFQALANIGESTTMIAHELNNLLSPISNYASIAVQNMPDKVFVEKALQKISKNCLRATKVMESILVVANGRPKEKQNFEILPIIEEIFDCLVRDFSKDAITVKIDISPTLKINAVPIDIQQVIMNLILNAREAMLYRGGVLTISAKPERNFIKIFVKDTGCGIEEENLKKIFEPFFTTKKDSNEHGRVGYGLGLAFIKKIIDEHNGNITVESQVNHGTTFIILLPAQ